MTISVCRYQAGQAGEWDRFVATSRNGTFLLERGFIDYHGDRFDDHSLLLYGPSGRLRAVLPGHAAGDEFHSHDGLTYGGLVYAAETGLSECVAMLDAVRAYLRGAGFSSLTYKTIPWIYASMPSEEDRFALFRAGATLARREAMSVLARGSRPRPHEQRRRGASRATKAGVQVVESGDLPPYWAMLEANLRDRHEAAPVHSLAEIALLASRFAQGIRLFVAHDGGELLAGVLVFDTPRVARFQYIASTPAGRSVGAMDALAGHLANQVYRDKDYIDYGTSSARHRPGINEGLVSQKEGFGARTVVHDVYRLELVDGSTEQ